MVTQSEGALNGLIILKYVIADFMGTIHLWVERFIP